MVWNKNSPVGTDKVRTVDDTMRSNQDAIETAIFAEHVFATGGDQTGRHKFGVGTTSARDALASQWVNGSIWFNTDLVSGFIVLQVYNSSSWVNVDVRSTGIPRLDAANIWTRGQSATWATSSPTTTFTPNFGGVYPNKITLTGDISIVNPTNKPVAGTYYTYTLEVVQDAAGGHTITSWGSDYIFPNSVSIPVSSAANARSMVYMTLLNDGKVLVGTELNLGA